MKVHLSFDVEVWCGGWKHLDARFPASFDRYVYGRSASGDFALPATLDILRRNGLKAVFFVEPLFSARFGHRYLTTIVRLIVDAGQEIQLHLHPEWTDEIRSPLVAEATRKRQHLVHYSRDEQTALIAWGKAALEDAGAGRISGFRSGSYAVNSDTFHALASCGIGFDSSLHVLYDLSAGSLPASSFRTDVTKVDSIWEYPVTVFRDGIGRLRPAQVGASSFGEMRTAIISAQNQGRQHFVIVSHNFELLRPDSPQPDWIVVRRFEQLCRFLRDAPDGIEVTGFPEEAGMSLAVTIETPGQRWPRAGFAGTATRHIEQLLRRWV